ncbi:MAG TPA: UvrD-helicase domain-containing protein [Phycisphaerales bacterium]|nr:UvrD-helicase domain-containing protein [Phycisphaerales bacterium]
MDAPGFESDFANDPLLSDLTPSQAEAVVTTDGPVLVLAGPGSGKTRVITRRIAYLLRQGVPPWAILAVTFTNKAAGEMRERITRLLNGPDAPHDARPPRGLTVATFHSLCVRLLRRYAEMAGFAERGLLARGGNFTVFDADDQSKLAKKILADLNFASQNFTPRGVLEQISSAKNQLMEPEEYEKRAGDFYTRCIARCYSAYQKELRQSNACDFDDLLLLTAKMLRESKAVREECQKRYRYILVDEYQDTNRAQLVIATLLAGERTKERVPNICVVGDPDQSIYAWRGADISNILQFEEQYGGKAGAKVVRLEENFRSVSPILDTASRLIKHNSKRKHKDLIATRGGGEKIEVVLCRDEHHEARLVVDWVRKLKEEGLEGPNGTKKEVEWKDCAVFYRTNALSRVMEDAFRNNAIPYAMVRGTAFFQREEVRDCVGYLRVVANFHDAVSHERIINKPTRGISDKTWDAISTAASIQGVGVPDALRTPDLISGITTRAQNAISKYVQQIDSWANPQAESFMGSGGEQQVELSLRDLVERIIRESGLEEHYRNEEEKRENLAEFVSSAADFEQRLTAGEFDDDEVSEGAEQNEPRLYSLGEKLARFLERVSLVADTDALNPASGSVTLMTLHAAKGLEFPVVAMIGLEEGILPHSRDALDAEAREEERRLCFVGITRAMDRLLITSATFRTVRGLQERQIPSTFLDEIKGDGVEISDQGYAGGSGFGGAFDEEDDPATARWSGRGGQGVSTGSNKGGLGVAGLGGGGEHRIDRSEFEAKPRSSAPFPVGSIVRHPQFGLGEVKGFMAGANARIKVHFKAGGEKTLVLEFARLERVK